LRSVAWWGTGMYQVVGMLSLARTPAYFFVFLWLRLLLGWLTAG